MSGPADPTRHDDRRRDGALPHPERIGPFRILQVLGEGGMGTVYSAEQTEPVRRRVALKVIKLGMDTKEVLARFEAERQALAVMDHPSITRVLDVGTTEEGRPYFAMELVQGVPLTEYCDRARLRTDERLELFRSVCQAVQHAHQKGIVHRDLKPSNILVAEHDDRPIPKVIDFGIAKALGHSLTERTLVTRIGDAIGTPAYMSPEQADSSGLDLDTRTDVYSLGVILYELLTGHWPHEQGGSAEKYLSRIAAGEAEPPTPSAAITTLSGERAEEVAHARRTTAVALRNELRGDLDWIVRKAIDGDRARRYATVNGLSTDLRRYLSDEPVEARAPTARYVLRKFVRRNPIGVAAATIVAVLLVAFSTIVGLQSVRLTRERNRAQAERDRAQAERDRAQAERDRANVLLLVAESRRASDLGAWTTSLRLAMEAARASPSRHASAAVRDALSFLPEQVVLSHEVRPVSAEFDPLGGRVLTTAGNEARLWNADGSGEPVVLRGHDGKTFSSFSADGRRVVTAAEDGTARVWSADGSGTPVVLRGHEGGVWSASFSPDGERVVTASDDRTVRVWNADGSGEVVVLPGHEGSHQSASFSPDGTRVLTRSGYDDAALLWSLDDPDEPLALLEHRGGVHVAVFSPDGNRILTCSEDRTARIWSADGTGEPVTLQGHQAEVHEGAFSPDGTRVVTGSADKTARIWRSDGSGDPVVLGEHGAYLESVAFSPDGTRVLTACGDSHARIWNADGSGRPVLLRGHERTIFLAEFSPDGSLVLTRSGDRTARVWQTDAISEPVVLQGHELRVTHVAFSPDGTRIVTVAWDETARIWSTDGTGEPIVLRGRGRIRTATFSRDGTRVVTTGRNGSAWTWNADGSGEPSLLRRGGEDVRELAVSPDSTRILTTSRASDGTVALVWTADFSGEPLPLRGHEGRVQWASFNADGTRIVTGGRDASVRIWSADGLGEPVVLRGHESGLRAVAFSPDGSRVVTSSGDSTARIWNADGSGDALVFRHGSAVRCVAFDPTGDRIVTGTHDGTARIWNADGSGEPIELRGHGSMIQAVAFSPDGTRVFTGSEDGTGRLWLARDEDALEVAAVRLSGLRDFTPEEIERFGTLLRPESLERARRGWR